MTSPVLVAVAALLVAAVVLWLWRGRGGAIPSGRLHRLTRIGRLSARLATSSAGARVRRLVARRGRSDMEQEARRVRDARAVTRAMGEMKGAFMKLGQMLSFVSDAVPAEYRAALESLQAEAPPLGFGAVRDVVERELGAPLERAFARFEREPIASASIGQVHRARLPGGEEVAVKVQYPGVADAIGADLANVGLLYRVVALLYPSLEPGPVVEELQARIGEELDYRREAINQTAFAELYRDHPFIRVPAVVTTHSTGQVLTSELVQGRRMAELAGAGEETRNRVAEVIYRFVFGSLIRFAVFNGDPHPGNYLIGERGEVIFLDYGCVKRFPDPMIATWTQLVRAHLEGRRGDFRALAVELRFMPADSSIETDLLYDYFCYFYEPFHQDRVFTFTQEYNSRSLAMVFRPEGKFAGLARRLNMPPDFLFVNRIQWGVYSILARLGATANWHRMHREYLYGDPPSTELGELDHAHRAAWFGARGLDGTALYGLDAGGRVRPRAAASSGNAISPRAPA
jgi:predicted unusual protein kinase regulating ubiquinone biosynthesis (AarF/ABC1/UbiB family)